MTEKTRNIFVLGLDEHQRQVLERLPDADEYRFHSLFGAEKIRGVEQIAAAELYSAAREQLEKWPAKIDGVISLLDFPATEIAALLSSEFGLPGPDINSVLRCNHKYWSRLVQNQAIPEAVPNFAAFDPFDANAVEDLENRLGYPFWVKPLNAYRSLLGFRVNNRAELSAAAEQLREGITRLAEPFAWVMQQATLPQQIAALPAHICIAESIIGGHQCTLEGYVYNGEPRIFAIVDSIRDPNGVSFSRYQYPSTLPEEVQLRMIDSACRAVSATGLDQAPFNVEFFYSASSDKIWLLEINPRLSQSHCELLEKVDGVSHQRIAIDLARGREPQIQHRLGSWPCAAKFFVRAFEPGQVTKVPDQERLKQIEQEIPGASIQMQVKAEDKLAELADQDSYSYELANIWLGGQDTADLLERFEKCRALLGIEIDN
ncbi:putative ligase/carboxylase protein [Halorhodospira halochloris]|uniref:Ligase/carboxylase protein n=1 Tax=Halorhodospira halochloris TaxID=1052 RepID=A0A0X8X941_HALHR|nr:ATP-grasp domain-containing protein [Halorhodospira halochloris]MBK1652853.1 hypothetical protein [Halorhodospira halochloris]BAU57332.1 putative ligase/carboxylase protein [Halorhodospira halochloris]